MFIEILLKDIVVVEPGNLRNNLTDETKNSLNAKYQGKIIRGKGICLKITNFKIVKSLIGNGSGNIENSVEFTCLVFSSFRGEYLTGTIKEMDINGIVVKHSGFNVLIPKENLFSNCKL